MKTEVIREGRIGGLFAACIANVDFTGLNEEDAHKLADWYAANVPQGCFLSVDCLEEHIFSEDEITKEVGIVYPYKIVRFIRD